MDCDQIAQSRRDYIKYTGALVCGGLLAGCSGGSGDGTTETATDTAQSSSDTAAGTEAGTDGTKTGSYTVGIKPVGDVTFDAVPETWLASTAGWADMGVALGQDPPSGLVTPSRYHTHFYDDIPGVSVTRENIAKLYDAGIDKELFYEHDADLHVFDPNFLTNRIENFGKADVEEVKTSVAPFFGNNIFTRNYAWHDSYRYYSMYEAFEKLAQVFQAQDRYKAFAELHESFRQNVRDRRPPESDRPSVGLIMPASEAPKKFYPFRIESGTGYKQWRDLGIQDAFEGSGVKTFTATRGTIGYEKLLQVDPDILMLYGHEAKSRSAFRDTFLSFFQDHETASSLTAVKNEAVYRAGGFYQGPILNLALTERAAHQVYPDEFGADEKLYDRKRVGDIVAGSV